MKRFETWLLEGSFVYRFMKNSATCLVVLVPIMLLIAQFVHDDLTFRALHAVMFSLCLGLLLAWRHDRA